MAVSLAFGVAFSTFVTLMLVPAGYLVLQDVHDGLGRVFRPSRGEHAGRTEEREDVTVRSVRLQPD